MELDRVELVLDGFVVALVDVRAVLVLDGLKKNLNIESSEVSVVG